jgi:hypothetical protein
MRQYPDLIAKESLNGLFAKHSLHERAGLRKIHPARMFSLEGADYFSDVLVEEALVSAMAAAIASATSASLIWEAKSPR